MTEEINDLIQQRLNKLKALKEKGLEPYGGAFPNLFNINELKLLANIKTCGNF